MTPVERKKSRERKLLVFKRHFVDGITYRKLGPEFGVSGERARQMCCQAFLLLRDKREFADHPLRAFMGRLKGRYTR